MNLKSQKMKNSIKLTRKRKYQILAWMKTNLVQDATRLQRDHQTFKESMISEASYGMCCLMSGYHIDCMNKAYKWFDGTKEEVEIACWELCKKFSEWYDEQRPTPDFRPEFYELQEDGRFDKDTVYWFKWDSELRLKYHAFLTKSVR